MKKLLFIVLIGYSAGVFGQDTTWTKSKANIWGTKAEKMYQDAIGRQSDNRFLCRFVGFKEFYDQNISEFMQLKYDFSLENSYNKLGNNIYILSKNGVYVGTKTPKVRMSFVINNNHRIVSGKITGSGFYLAYVFLNYWPQTPQFTTMEQLKPGIVAIKHCYGDLISFKKVGENACITITKDPNLTVPVPLAAN